MRTPETPFDPGRGSVLAAVLAIVCLTGCSSILAPQHDPSRFFALSVAAEPPRAGAETAPAADARTLGVGPVSIPDYLDRNELCTRLSETELAYAPAHRWAAPLRESFASVLAEDLGVLLEGSRVLLYPWAGETVDLQIEVRVRHFETDADGESRLVARWTARDGATGRALLVRESRHARSAEGSGPGASVQALSRVLADLAVEVARATRALATDAAGSRPSTGSARLRYPETSPHPGAGPTKGDAT